ncbi:MAG: 4-hydroxy-tetrahydrodipicolinate reductase [Bacteroidales bacterium]|nr:4-hydroxy-tetrahydrodipicolinate reductase [Bacteroidales bacterium]MDT8430000.1 4-hydroxy-tetrahydrodipicolinate reductase [Bacteroidales bacterium]
MRLAIIGYGKMGQEIAAVARERNHSIDLVIDADNTSDLNKDNLAGIDVAIEFSSPDAAFNNILTCLREQTPVVSGTTGWLDRWEEVKKVCDEQSGALFYASNFSIGVNILFAINETLAAIMNGFPQFEVCMEEIHHIHKLDAPSGTAITLAEQIAARLESKDSWSLEKGNPRNIHIEAKREGEVNGFHSVRYDSEADTISISHNAKSRKGFATGAVMAAEYLEGKKGIHSMKEMLNLQS